jgi:hypothetical protein
MASVRHCPPTAQQPRKLPQVPRSGFAESEGKAAARPIWNLTLRDGVLSAKESDYESRMRNLWRSIVNFFVEALADDTSMLAQRNREAALRRERWLRYLS